MAFIAIFGWNWLRDPIQRMATEKTGRELVINGEMNVKFGWPLARIHASASQNLTLNPKTKNTSPLALIPLIDAGPGKDSDCGQLVRDARLLPRAAHNRKTSRPRG